MEENQIRYQSQSTVSSVLNQLLYNTYSTVNLHKIERKVTKILPKSHISYMQKVSDILSAHREPQGVTKEMKSNITQPNEAYSYISPLRFEWNNEYQPQKTDRVKMSKKMSKRSENDGKRKESIRLSQMSRRSQEFKSRKLISSKRTFASRKIVKMEPPKLIPLKSQSQTPSECDEKIQQLRRKKIKLQQALRLFLEVETIQVQKTERKKKETNTSYFTTDYKGKIINFSQRKEKGKEVVNFPVRVHTVLDSPKPWGKINLTATSKRGFKEPFLDVTNK